MDKSTDSKETMATLQELEAEIETKQTELTEYVLKRLDTIQSRRSYTTDSLTGLEIDRQASYIMDTTLDTEDSLMELLTRYQADPYKLLLIDDVRVYAKTLSARNVGHQANRAQRLLSINDSEHETEIDSYHVSLPKQGRYDVAKSIIKSLAYTDKGQRRKGITSKHLRLFAKMYLSGKTQKECFPELTKMQVSRIRKRIDQDILSLPYRDNVSSRFYSGTGSNWHNSITPSIWEPIYNEEPSTPVKVDLVDYVPTKDNPVILPLPKTTTFPVKGRHKPYVGYLYANGKTDLQTDTRTIAGYDYTVKVPIDGSGSYDKGELLKALD